MPDILLLSDDVVGEKMAGPGIRAWELARALSRRFRVALAVPEFSPGGRDFFRGAPFEVAFYSAGRPGDLVGLAGESRLLLVQGYVLSKFPPLKRLDRPIIADIYDPFVLENLFVYRRMVANLRDRDAAHLHDLRVFNDLLLRGDHFLCASERQKDLFAGALMSLARIGPRTLDAGAGLEDLISVVPFGISDDDDGAADTILFRRAFPRIEDRDVVFLWGGVLSSWFDPESLLRAFAEAAREDARLKLVFLSSIHPNPLLPVLVTADEARRTAQRLGLLGSSVFFYDDWVEYKKRGAFFGRANVGVSIHDLHFETRFSFRTRMLDYLKHGLPVLCTEGDYFAGLVASEDLGEVVASRDVEGIRKAIRALASNPGRREEIKRRIEVLKPRFSWERTAEPLMAFSEKILSGSFRPAPRPSSRDVAAACSGVSPSRVRGWLKKRIWPRDGKLKLKTLARVRRLFRF